MTARLMKLSGLAETLPVERTRKPARPAAKPAATRRRAPAAKPAVALDVASTPPAELPSARAGHGRRLRRLALVWMSLVVLVAAAAVAAFLVLDPFDRGAAGAPAAMSTERLAAFASAHDGPVYWAGPLPSRTLELTTTSVGTYVRYLALDAPVGDSARAITVGTYPMPNAYATAASRAKAPAMTSRETSGGGLVVWSQKLPTSVYLAFPGVPQLVEVYAPDADDARTLALSGRIRPVR
jgi:hypothetical protein